ncbi:hypothetical protein PG994_014440 [Apiospora phragmitis]|uniref:Uncharacterized protein n=1 Tax=Apiospora phragmitis TaxID=2905665 RepID=A0ABR1T6Q2_9PEZI
MAMGCGSSKDERVPEWEPATRSTASLHNRQGQKPSRPATSNAHGQRTLDRLPRLRVPSGVAMEGMDSVEKAMARNPECADEDSPTWLHLRARNQRENKDVRSIDEGYNIHGPTHTGVPLERTDRECVWTTEMIQDMTSGHVIIEARRRVRKYYTERLERLQGELNAILAARQTQPTHIPISEAQKWEQMKRKADGLHAEIEALRNRIDGGLHAEKDEAMKRVMPLLSPRWKE